MLALQFRQICHSYTELQFTDTGSEAKAYSLILRVKIIISRLPVIQNVVTYQ
jgi:hypothetical protein